MTEPTGLIYDMPEADYFATPGYSQSDIKLAMQALAKVEYRRTHPKPQTPAQLVGSMTHCLALEDAQFNSRYRVAPAIDKTTKPGKLAHFRFRAELLLADGITEANEVLAICDAAEDGPLRKPDEARCREILSAEPSRLIVTPAQAVLSNDMAQAVQAHPEARAIIAASDVEVSAFADIDGIRRKARYDIAPRDRFQIWDLKKTINASPDGFGREIYKWGYHIQAAQYADVYHAITGTTPSFGFIAVEEEPPHLVGVYVLDETDIDQGRADIAKHLPRLIEAERSGVWPGYSQAVEPIRIPGWARRDLEMEGWEG